jgi:hypothetical protein
VGRARHPFQEFQKGLGNFSCLHQFSLESVKFLFGREMVMEQKKGDFFKSGLGDEIADVEASVDEVPFLSIHIRDPGVGHFHPTEADIFYVD